MYVGRIVGVGRTEDGNNFGVYRVSSRSFPNRSAVVDDDGQSASIESRPGAEDENAKNIYVAYRCVQVLKDHIVISNGAHTGPIADKINAGIEPKESLTSTLLEMGYEQDDYSTPRIAGVVPKTGDHAWLASVREDGIVTQQVELQQGAISYIATYEHNGVDPNQLLHTHQANALEIAREAVLASGVWAGLEHPVTSAAAVCLNSGTADLAVADGQVK